jgi:hypothetical protein
MSDPCPMCETLGKSHACPHCELREGIALRAQLAEARAECDRLRSRLREAMDRTDAQSSWAFGAEARAQFAEGIAEQAMREGLAAVRAEAQAALYWMDRADAAEARVGRLAEFARACAAGLHDEWCASRLDGPEAGCDCIKGRAQAALATTR